MDHRQGRCCIRQDDAHWLFAICSHLWCLPYGPACRHDYLAIRRSKAQRESLVAAMGSSTPFMGPMAQGACGRRTGSAINMVRIISFTSLRSRVPGLTLFSFFSGNAILAFRLLSHDWTHHHDHSSSFTPSTSPPYSVRLEYRTTHPVVAQDGLSSPRFPLSVHHIGGYCGHSQSFHCGCNCWSSGLCFWLVVQRGAVESVASGGLLSLAGSNS